MANVKLSPPWVKLYNQITALFAHDPEVHVTQDETTYAIKLYVDNPVKADALSHILPTEKVFGNITVKITVVPANKDDDPLGYILAAFNGNDALTFTRSEETPFGTVRYAVFKPEVVQYYNDNMQDISGKESTLYETIAKDVLAVDGVFFCTDVM